jgi:hypothetical protein
MAWMDMDMGGHVLDKPVLHQGGGRDTCKIP